MSCENLTRSLLDRLPYDIRIIVYEHALGNQRIHLTPHKGRLGCVPCVAPERAVFDAAEEHLRDECMLEKHQSQHCAIRTIQVASPPTFSPQWVAVPDLGIGLLRTCRQVYAESAHLVYLSNLFLIHSLGALFRFVEMVPPHRLRLVKDIYVNHNIKGADFTLASYGAQGIQKMPMEMAPLFMFDYFDVPKDESRTGSSGCIQSGMRAPQPLIPRLALTQA